MRGRGGIALLALAVWPVLPLAAQEAAPGAIEAQALSPQRGAAGGGALPVETPSVQGALPILTIDPQSLFLHSAWGRRVNDSIGIESKEIEAENDRLADEFAREEQELTALRGSLPADEFRRRADEFDKRVVEVRRQRDGVLRALDTRVDAERTAFFRAALPILEQVMKERGAQVVLNHSATLAALPAVDVTEDLVARVDSEIGAGPAEEEDEASPSAPPPAGNDAPAATTPPREPGTLPKAQPGAGQGAEPGAAPDAEPGAAAPRP